jgi:hypothetical protein
MHFMSQVFTKKYPYMKSKPTMTKPIENKLYLLKNSQESDKIHTEVLKTNSPFICSLLNCIYAIKLSIGIFSDRLKYSIIKQFTKKVISVMYLIIDECHF